MKSKFCSRASALGYDSADHPQTRERVQKYKFWTLVLSSAVGLIAFFKEIGVMPRTFRFLDLDACRRARLMGPGLSDP